MPNSMQKKAARNAVAPPWRPLRSSEQALTQLHERWRRRNFSELDDADPATICSTTFTWANGMRNPSWRALKKLWRFEEAGGPRCTLCSGPLAIYSILLSLAGGFVDRMCVSCRVTYPDSASQSAIEETLRAALLRSDQPEGFSVTFSLGSAPRKTAKKNAHSFANGSWSRRPPKGAGRYLVASLDGTRAEVVTIDLGETGIPQRPAITDWWWSREVGVGVILPSAVG